MASVELAVEFLYSLHCPCSWAKLQDGRSATMKVLPDDNGLGNLKLSAESKPEYELGQCRKGDCQPKGRWPVSPQRTPRYRSLGACGAYSAGGLFQYKGQTAEKLH